MMHGEKGSLQMSSAQRESPYAIAGRALPKIGRMVVQSVVAVGSSSSSSLSRLNSIVFVPFFAFSEAEDIGKNRFVTEVIEFSMHAF